MFWFGLVLFVLVGGEAGAIAAGAFQLGDDGGSGVVEFVVGINALPWTALLAVATFSSGRRRRLGLSAAGPTEAAAARIEASKAVGEGPNFPVQLDLTVAPEGRPAFRVDAKSTVNLMDLDRLRPGGYVVVDYEPLRPWKVAVRPDPGAEWIERITLAEFATAPEGARQKEPVPPVARRYKWYALTAAAAGFCLWFAVFK